MRVWTLIALIVFTTAFAWTVRAEEPTPERRAAAIELAREGLDLFGKEKWPEAYQKFFAADRFHHAPTLVLYMARSKAKMGELIAARDLYKSLLKDALKPGAPAQFVSAKDDAYRELEAVTALIPQLMVRLTGPAATRARVLVDGKALDGPAVGQPLALDPGEHTIVVEAKDEVSVSRTVTLEAAAKITEIELKIGQAKPTPRPDVIEDEGSLVPAGVAFAFGGAGLILGGVMGGLAFSKSSDIKDQCTDARCPPSLAEDGDSATLFAHVSTVGFGVGGAAVLLGIVLVIVQPGGDSSELEIAVGPDSVYFRGTF